MTEPNDLMRRIGRAADAIDPAFTERDVQRLVDGARRRARRRRVRRLALGGLGVGAVAIVLALRLGGPASRAPVVAAAPAPAGAPQPLRLADGSVATPLDAGTALALREASPRRVTLELARGRGRFEVAPNPEREFRVHAGDVTVTVLGTAFTVERVADRIGVTVERGKVMVDWGVGSRRLTAGDSGWFPPLVVGAHTEPVPPPLPGPRARPAGPLALASAPASRSRLAPGAVPVAAPPGREAPRSRVAPVAAPVARATVASAAPESRPTPVARGAAPPAESPSPSPPPFVPPAPRAADDRGERSDGGTSAAGLLAAADAARLDGRPADGAALLRRVLREHRDDPRAPLAAFTLGRVLLQELNRPRKAAVAFATARALAPDGPFAEDALGREAEAWSAAGDKSEAAARARDYLRRYPSGRRAAAMRAVAGQ